jgi:hypothetical protein
VRYEKAKGVKSMPENKSLPVGNKTQKVTKIPTVKLKHKDTIKFKAESTRTVVVIPRADELFGLEWCVVCTLDKGEESKPYEVTKKLKPGAEEVPYHYAVYCDGDDDFAEGEASSPVMLIGPP